MAKAIIGGLIGNGFNPRNISAADPMLDNLKKMQDDWSIQASNNNGDVIEQADIVVLAIKPQQMAEVCADIQTLCQQKRPLIISIAAGITVAMLERWLHPDLSIIRCMPNTPALVKCGATGIFANPNCSTDQKAVTEQLVSAIGIANWVEKESLLDIVTALSGSGPAYFFLVMEAMQDAAIALGLDEQSAKDLTLQTALGAATMAIASDVDAAELRRRVTSPGGTTAAALAIFEEKGLRQCFDEALKAADTRSKSLAAEME